jgi:2-oxoisovalerate dehydrogenase E1 component
MFNLARSLDRNADRFPDADALIFRGGRLTHAGLLARVSALAAAFAGAGVKKGDVVALFLGNRPEFLEAALAANRIGAAFLPLNVRLAEPELEYIVGHAGAVAIVTEQALAAPVAAIAGRMTPPLMVVTVGEEEGGGGKPAGNRYESILAAHRGVEVPAVEVGQSDLHRLMYSSGTTSRPKGVPITYGNFYWKTIAHVAEFGLSAADRTVMAGPMYHVGAFDLPGIGTWWVGGSLVIIRRFDVADLLETIERERPTNVWLAPAMVNAILQAPELGRFDTSSIRFIIGGGEKMPVTLIERLLAAFPNGRFADAYGLTETVAGDTFLDQAHTLSKIGSVGKPVLNLDVKIADPDDPNAEPGQSGSGEILLRGPKVVSGYWKDPAATAAAFTPDGWLRTGDIGHLDKDGYLYIDDRKKDMIVSGGENVATSEVERVLYENDAVLEAAVVGMPDPRWGEVPRAFIVLKPGQDITAEALIGHCRARLAGFKTPKEIVFLDTLPRNPSGKVLKRELRQLPDEDASEGEQERQTVRLSTTDLIEAYGRMTLIRVFEERVSVLYRDGEVPGFVHLSIGQEASAVGACWPLGTADVITSNHRGHGHCLAKGLAPEPMMAELLARSTGTNKGLGGSMHIADPSLGIFGANGIVAAGVPIAAGAGVAAQLRKQNHVVVSFFGDGAVAQGAFHEAANLASLWKLPIVFFCENNGYAEFSPLADQHPIPLSTRAAGYGMEYVALDGNDVEAVASAMSGIVDRIRAGAGPVFVEATTYRWHGHYEGDPERYRSKEETSHWQADRDPVAIARARLAERGVTTATLDAIDTEIRGRIEAAVAAARQAPLPDPAVISSALYAPRPRYRDVPVAKDAEIFKTMDAVRLALEYELEHDREVFLAGVDVGKGGNVFALTRGLYDRWPDRLLDTPISETAVMGLAVGAAMAGMRPVVELMYLDFLGVCFDQILNQAAKLRFMTGGNASMGLTIRTQFGGGRSSGSQHSQSLEALLAHIPGLTVVMPSTPADTYGLLRAAIRDPNPVIFIENRQLYGAKGPKPPADYLLPLGQAKIVRPGTDVTVVSVSRMVHEATAAADELAKRGISAEVIDLRTVAPLDKETILESLSRTGRLVVAHEAVTDFGIGAEIAAIAASDGFWKLDAPVRRVAPPPTPVPYAPNLEKQWLPDRKDIERAIEEVVRA